MIYHIYANRLNISDWLSAKGIQKLLLLLATTEYFCDESFVEETMQALSKATKKEMIIIGGGGIQNKNRDVASRIKQVIPASENKGINNIRPVQ